MTDAIARLRKLADRFTCVVGYDENFFDGATPDGARAKAAAWVLAQNEPKEIE